MATDRDFVSRFGFIESTHTLSSLCTEYKHNFTLYDYLVLRYLVAYHCDENECIFYEGVRFKIMSLTEHLPLMTELIGCTESDVRISLGILFNTGVLPIISEFGWDLCEDKLYIYIPPRCRCILFYENGVYYYNNWIPGEPSSTSKLRTDTSVGWVYCFYNQANSLTKIGKSTNVKNRKRDIERSIGVSLDFVAAVKVSKYSSFEYDMHKYFDSSRENGEWFKIDYCMASDMLHHFQLVADAKGYKILEYMRSLV